MTDAINHAPVQTAVAYGTDAATKRRARAAIAWRVQRDHWDAEQTREILAALGLLQVAP